MALSSLLLMAYYQHLKIDLPSLTVVSGINHSFSWYYHVIPATHHAGYTRASYSLLYIKTQQSPT